MKRMGINLLVLFLSGYAVWAAEHRITVRAIELKGNRHFSNSDILRTMNLSPGSLFSPEQLQEDMANILEAYTQSGFFMAELRQPVLLFSDDSSGVSLGLSIIEGPEMNVASIDIAGNNHFTREAVLDGFETRMNRPLLSYRLERDIDNLLNLYEENGYPFCRIEPEHFHITGGDHVTFSLKINEGPQIRVGNMFITGNETTKARVIIRETRLKEGEIYRQSKIEGAQKRIERLGFFSSVSPLSIQSVRGDTVDLTLDVKEGKTSAINGVIGYTPAQGDREGYLTGLVDLSLMNLLGTGRKVDVLWHRRDPYSSNLAFGYEEPWIFGTPVGLGCRLEQIDQDSTYVLTRAHITLGAALTGNLEGNLQFGWERVVPDSGSWIFLARSTKYTAGAQALYDTRDDPQNPRRGLCYRTSVEYGRKRNRATAAYNPEHLNVRTSRFTLDLEHFVPTFSRQTVAVALHGREFQSGEKPAPISEHFRLGGSTTLRGYREDQFTGTRVAWSNIEYRYLLTSASRAFLFVDGGTYFREQTDPDTETIERIERRKFGYGLGVRLESRLGIIGLDFGLGEGDSFSQGKFHFRLENRF